jgi:hypothetical protein
MGVTAAEECDYKTGVNEYVCRLSMLECGASEPATWIDRGRGRRFQARRLIAERYQHDIRTLLT